MIFCNIFSPRKAHYFLKGFISCPHNTWFHSHLKIPPKNAANILFSLHFFYVYTMIFTQWLIINKNSDLINPIPLTQCISKNLIHPHWMHSKLTISFNSLKISCSLQPSFASKLSWNNNSHQKCNAPTLIDVYESRN